MSGAADLHPIWVDRHFDPTAGACAIGARKLLVAFNVNLNTEDLAIAKAIARKIRASSGGLPFVKAMGVPLASRKLVQVSMNLTDFERTPLQQVYEAVLHRGSVARSIDRQDPNRGPSSRQGGHWLRLRGR